MGLGPFEAQPDSCQVHVERMGEKALVRVAGDLDLAGHDVLDKILAELPGDGDASGVIVDLRGLDFVDSHGLRVLLDHRLRSQEEGFDLDLIPPRGHPRDVFDRTGIGQVINLLPDPDAPTSEGAQAGERASAGLGTDGPDPADWLHRKPG